MPKQFYVVLRRVKDNVINRSFKVYDKDYVTLFDFEEARRHNWVDENGDRVWVVPAEEERIPTFVWGFDDLEQAMLFYDLMRQNELGIQHIQQIAS